MLRKLTKPLIAFIVPTGIGASIGGFAGDASRYAAKFARNFHVIVNPNTVNAACFSGITENMLYLEGFAFSEFVKGNINLIPSKNNKIGVIFDKGISKGVLNVHLNVINAVKTVYGIDIIGYEITDEPCDVKFYKAASGISAGSVNNNKTLLRAGKRLIERGAQAIACVCAFDEPEEDNYQNGEGVDVVGGIEAVISHYLTRELGVQTVHAPAFEDITITKELVNAKAAAEYITPSFLPCLLTGLNNAPLIFPNIPSPLEGCENADGRSETSPVSESRSEHNHPAFGTPPQEGNGEARVNAGLERKAFSRQGRGGGYACIEKPPNCITRKDLKALVMPYNALGASIVTDAIDEGIKVFAVKENSSVLKITKNIIKKSGIIETDTYDECLKQLEEILNEKE